MSNCHLSNESDYTDFTSFDKKFPYIREFAARLQLDVTSALGLVWFLQRASAECELRCIPEDDFWEIIMGRVNDFTQKDVIDAYHRYLELIFCAQT